MRISTVSLIGSSCLGLAICILAPTSQALTVQEVPNPRQMYGGWVTDSAGILSAATETELNQMIQQLKTQNQTEIAVVTVPETKPAASPKAFATELFNYWHIGKQGQDNGVLFLISKGDRRVEIETGYGVEALLPDAKVGQIIEQKVTPQFKQGDFDGGTLAGTEALVTVLEGQELNLDSPKSFPIGGWSMGLLIIGGLASLYQFTRQSAGKDLQGLAGLITYRLFRRSIDLQPDGESRTLSWHQWFERPATFHCANCGQPLQQLPPDVVTAQLTPAQKVAEQIGSTQFIGWRCSTCGPNTLHLRAYENPLEKFRRCPECQELTLLKQKSTRVEEPGPLKSGLLSTTYHCECCHYEEVIETEIPYRTFAGNYDSGGGFGSGSSGGSDFGGGSSGGGGGGGSW